MEKNSNHRSKVVFLNLTTIFLALLAFIMVGCSDQGTNPGTASTESISQMFTSSGLPDTDPEPIEETMQISPYMINLQSKGTAESVHAIIGLYIPGNYHLTDYSFTLSFNGVDVTDANDCYYCYIDDNLIISFDKSEVLTSPVTIDLANSEAVAAVNGFFRVESDDDSYDTELSTVARVEIISPANADPGQNLTDTPIEY